MSAPAPTQPAAGFRQHLGLFDATMLVAGSMIGSGIFIVSADIANDVGSAGWLLFIWVLTGVMTIIGALSFAELAAMMPNAGGQYVFLREAYGPLPAFLYGWTNFLVIQTGFIAAVGVAFAKFLAVFVPALGDKNVLWHLPGLDISAGQLVSVAIAVLLTLVNCLGVREGKWVQNVFTVAKCAGLVMLIVVGLTLALNEEAIALNFDDPWSGIHDTKTYKDTANLIELPVLAVALVLCGAMVGGLFSADAWGNVTFTAAEVKNPRRNLPWSLVLGTGMVILLYLLANVTYVATLPVRANEKAADRFHEEAREWELKAEDLARKIKPYKASADTFLGNVKHLRAEAEKPDYTPTIGAEFRKKADADERKAAALLAKIQPLEEERNLAVQEAHKLKERASLYDDPVFARGIQKAKDERVAIAVMERAWPDLGVSLMAIAIMISTFGCVNGIVLAGSRLYYAMAQDGLFFRAVGKLNSRGVPAAGLILQGAWSIVLIFSGNYNQLLDYIIFGALLFYVFTVGALFVLRRTQPDWPRPYRAFGYPVVPAVYIALCAIIMLGLLVVKPLYCWPSFIIILTGIPVYWLWRKKPSPV